MRKSNSITLTCFWLSLIIFLSFPILKLYKVMGGVKVLFFAPYLSATFYSKSKEGVLVQSLFLGLLQDIFSSTFFGVHMALYVLASITTYPLKKWFLEDKIPSIPLISVAYSLSFTLFSHVIFFLFNFSDSFSRKILWEDIKISFSQDFPYSLLVYVIPCIITRGSHRMFSLIRRLV